MHPDSNELSRQRFQAALKLWGWPIALGLLSASGLVSALVSDSWGDAWAWFALGLPVLVMTRYALRR
ncbi:hypothetical protein ACS5PN_07620 [Roseateles sp. NT4]|uniref:hypothetical protein n=1 Tax=Roseateles sp. NT4 TaxID=3453715 RepID=UPI003EF02DE7